MGRLAKPASRAPSSGAPPQCAVHALSSVHRRPGEQLSWAEIAAVEVHTNDTGPLGTDVWFVLRGTDGALAVPQGATGDSELFDRLQKLPGFDNAVLIEAMACTDNRVFRCWTRPAPTEPMPRA